MRGTVTILGSTGSVGESTIRVLKFLQGEFRVYGLACSRNLGALGRQIAEMNPSAVAVGSPDAITTDEYRLLKKKHAHVEFLEGGECVAELAARKADIVVSAIAGSAGLKPSLAAIRPGVRIALANKETLVMAGSIFMERIRSAGAELIPVDSEHSALFNLLACHKSEYVERIILTASGGSLREVPHGDLASVTPERALNHPVWEMGKKITIDSATLMNKGLEVIEAHHLFGLEYDRIGVVIHPESVVHSMVETIDGALYAHLGVADMAFPILNAFTYPEKARNIFGRLRIEDALSLNFSGCEKERYPALELCYRAGREGGTMPAALNAANEAAVEAFLNKKILFTDIVKIVEKVMDAHAKVKDPDLEDIYRADLESRNDAGRLIKGR